MLTGTMTSFCDQRVSAKLMCSRIQLTFGGSCRTSDLIRRKK